MMRDREREQKPARGETMSSRNVPNSMFDVECSMFIRSKYQRRTSSIES
jgi:hypothetical protein